MTNNCLRSTTSLYCSIIISLYLYIYIALVKGPLIRNASCARDPERIKEQTWENEKRHLAHSFIRTIVSKKRVGYKAQGQWLHSLVS